MKLLYLVNLYNTDSTYFTDFFGIYSTRDDALAAVEKYIKQIKPADGFIEDHDFEINQVFVGYSSYLEERVN